MQVHTLKQGAPEWHAYRAAHFNASDAPAMMGCSPYKSRSELLHERHTGVAPDVDAGTQRASMTATASRRWRGRWRGDPGR